MSLATTQNSQSSAAIIFAVFAVACLGVFLAFRGGDVGHLPKLIGNLGGGPLFGPEGVALANGILTALVIFAGWTGLGSVIDQIFKFPGSQDRLPWFDLALKVSLGASAWSAIFFFAGIAGAYSPLFAVATVVVSLALSVVLVVRGLRSKLGSRSIEAWRRSDLALVALIAIAVFLAFVASLAPPTAKDALLYHVSLPHSFITQGSNAFVDGNIASYLALGTEMHSTWAMLLGSMFSTRTAEIAAGATTFLFYPLLIVAVYGWAREIGTPAAGALVAAAIIACVPTAYHVAASGYIDLSLALYVTLAAYALTRWWKEQTWRWAILIAVFLGAALSVKLTTVFVMAAFALVVLLKARGSENAGRVVGLGFGALLLAGVIASPWYIRTWIATGSPVFPFYMSIWPGKANGWDVERSNLFQAMNSHYGGTDVNKLNLLTAPVRVSVAAQPEQPAYYDGVLGVAFLIGLPLLVYALWNFDLGPEIKIMTGVAGVMYLFWLFSSEQLRYLLPIVPLLAIAIVASIEKIGGSVAKVAKCGLVAASVCGLLTIFAWFCQKAPLRVVLGGETRDEYLTRNLDYYPYYQQINTNAPADAKVWLINMRRDTYNIERPVVSDYLFEDWTLRKMLWQSRDVSELKAKAASLGTQYILTRNDFLFDYDRSTLVDEKRPRVENESKLAMARELILDPQRTIKKDDKFSLVKLY